MEIYVKNYFHMFSIFWFSIMILSYTLILSMSQLQTQQLMTSQIRSHIEYWIQTYDISVLILYLKLMRNVSALAVMTNLHSGLLFWATLYCAKHGWSYTKYPCKGWGRRVRCGYWSFTDRSRFRRLPAHWFERIRVSLHVIRYTNYMVGQELSHYRGLSLNQ